MIASISRFQPHRKFESFIKQNVYADGHQFTSKDVLWAIIKAAAEAVQPITTKELIDSTTSRKFEVIRQNDAHVAK